MSAEQMTMVDAAACQNAGILFQYLKSMLEKWNGVEQDHNGNNVLHLAAHKKNVLFFDVLSRFCSLYRDSIECMMLHQNTGGYTPAHLAVASNSADVISYWHHERFPGFAYSLNVRESISEWTPSQLAQILPDRHERIVQAISSGALPPATVEQTQDAVDRMSHALSKLQMQ